MTSGREGKGPGAERLLASAADPLDRGAGRPAKAGAIGTRSRPAHPGSPTRIYLLTDVLLYAEGLARILEQEAAIEVTGATARAAEAVEAVTRDRVEVMLLDLQPPEGPEVARRMRAAAPGVKVVALAVPEDDEEIIAWAEAGMQGFLPRDGSLEDLVAMIRSVARGETICSPRIAATLVRRVATLAGSGERTVAEAPDRLTSREMEIVRLVAAGLSNKEIARSLRIALPTVKNHIHNVLEKLQVRRRSEAASAVLRPSVGRRMDLGY